MARRDEGAYLRYVTEEQRGQPRWIGREIDRLSHSRALRLEPEPWSVAASGALRLSATS
jgi:hypothetical protein